MTAPPPRHAGASPTLAAIRAAHTAVFFAQLASILWLLASGLAGRRDRSVAVAAALVAGEGAVFLANDGVCPLTPLAERHGAQRGSVSDIYLPDALARTIPLWATALVAMAVVLHGVGIARERQRRDMGPDPAAQGRGMA